jgi:hypothetical protein
MAAHGGSARTDGAAQRGSGGDGGGGAASEPDRPTPISFEYRSRLRFGGLPLIHVVRGIDPSSGRRPPAVGLIAVGQVAVGLIAIGQVAIGFISIGQAAIGLGWGIGQLAFGLIAAGQVAAGLLGAVGQIATGPHGLGMVSAAGPWVAFGWLLGGACLAAAMAEKRRRLAPLVTRPVPSLVSEVRDGGAHVAAEVVSFDQLQAPLSSRPCVFWHAIAVGPAGRTHERGGGEVTIADGSGTARIDFRSEVMFIRSGDYTEMVGPDWALHLETALARGDTLHVAGPVTLAPDPSAAGHRTGGISPLFAGRPGAPVVVTTEAPATFRAALGFAAAVAWTLIGSGVLAIALGLPGLR